jgi:hypothetical protein
MKTRRSFFGGMAGMAGGSVMKGGPQVRALWGREYR